MYDYSLCIKRDLLAHLSIQTQCTFIWEALVQVVIIVQKLIVKINIFYSYAIYSNTLNCNMYVCVRDEM